VSVVTLLTKTDNVTFAFEHMMAHRNYFIAMAPLSAFSVLPYMLDPEQNTDQSGTSWHLNHQQSHNDALPKMPGLYGRFGTHDPVGLFIGQNLRDTDLSDQDQLTWWTFANHMEHYIANDALLPTYENMPFQFPFW
jgi:hypothetical protein